MLQSHAQAGRTGFPDRALLLAVSALFVVVFVLHVREVARTGLAQPPVFAVYQGSDAYPVVGGIRIETGPLALPLQVGDRLIAVGGEDLRGRGFIDVDALVLEHAGLAQRTAMVFERDGVRSEAVLPVPSRPYPWSRIPGMLAVALLTILAYARSRTRSARTFFLGFMGFAILQSIFFGGPRAQSIAAGLVWNLGGPLVVALLFRWAILFPDEVPDEKRPWRGWAWVAGAAYAAVRVNYLFGVPLPTAWLPPIAFGLHALFLMAGPAIVALNMRHASPVGRRRSLWVLYGGVLGGLGLAIFGLLPLLDPGGSRFAPGFSLSALATMAFPLCVFIALVRFNLFDIDRLISATANVVLVLASLAAAAAVAASFLAEPVSAALGIGPDAARVALLFALAVGAVPFARRLRPTIDRLFDPERDKLERGVAQLMSDLSHCHSTPQVLARVRDGVAYLLRPETCHLYQREGEVFRAQGVEAEIAVSDPRAVALALAARPQRDLAEGADPGRADVLLPIRQDLELAAIVRLGPKRSGDVYTAGEVSLLGSVCERASAEVRRHHDAEVMEQQRQLLAELSRLKAEAEQANRSKSRFLAAASHDLRQPIHALGLFADLLTEQVQEGPARHTAQQIRRSLDGLAGMLNALLDLSRLDAGNVEPERTPIALDTLIERLCAEFEPLAKEKGLELRHEVPACHVNSDALLLRRILQNLLENAIRYTDAGHVAVRVQEIAGQARITVEDTGRGIPTARQHEIFEEFVQLEPSGSAVGLGLGLSIVRRLGRLLGHEIEFTSEAGRGTRVTVSVPVVRARAAERAAPAAVADAPASGFAVVVDDDLAILAGMRQMLERWGWTVLLASSGADALAGLGGRRPDVIVADWRLRDGETGGDAIAAIRDAAGAAVPAVVVTGDTAAGVLDELRARSLPWLTKPVEPARLRAVMQECLQRGASAPDATG